MSWRRVYLNRHCAKALVRLYGVRGLPYIRNFYTHLLQFPFILAISIHPDHLHLHLPLPISSTLYPLPLSSMLYPLIPLPYPNIGAKPHCVLVTFFHQNRSFRIACRLFLRHIIRETFPESIPSVRSDFWLHLFGATRLLRCGSSTENDAQLDDAG